MNSDLFGPPASNPPPLWAAACGVGALAMVASLLLSGSHRVPTEAARERHAAAPTAARTAVASRLQDVLPLPAHDQPRLVVKCVRDGRVSYSDVSGCRGKATQLAFADAGDPAAAPAPRSGLPTLDDSQRRVETLAAIEPSGAAAMAREPSACDILAHDIATLDTTSRRALTAHEQDRVRITRQRVRAQQTSLGCQV